MDPIDLSDPELEKAATKIQATFKGYKARKEIGKDAPGDAATEASSSAQQLEEEIDIDLNDPEVEKAATKIQATFKGYKVRREAVQQSKQKE